MLATLTVQVPPVHSSELIIPPANPCIPDLDFVCAEATGFVSYEHFHRLAIPVSVLITPPQEGFETRTTTLDQRSLDEEAFKKFLTKTGLKEQDIRFHSHAVKITQEELERIASGEERVKIFVKTPKGNFGHEFFFTATKSALIKIQRGRSGGQ
jgi:hypothetical protein